jgi:hypothetical protein
MGMLPQALEIIFEVQRKRSNEKLTRRKISIRCNFLVLNLFLMIISASNSTNICSIGFFNIVLSL